MLLGAYFLYLLWLQEKSRERRRRQAEQEREEVRERERAEIEERRREVEDHERREAIRREEERLERQLALERERRETEEQERYDARRLEEDRIAASASGAGSGGYIVVEMPEGQRPLFHDLLKGFEDYAKLKGYPIAFSIDSSYDGRIAFKFTVKDDCFVVGPERVRRDFKEYVERVNNKDIDDLDQMPVITSLEEHNLIVTLLKNRISFLQHSYQLTQNAVKFYEGIIANVRSFPALPAPSVVVQTGGNIDSRNYNAVNSQRLIQGDRNTVTDSSVNIGGSFNERQDRILALDDLINKLKAAEAKGEAADKIERELQKVRDELADYEKPNEPAIRKWLEYAKNAMTGSILSYEIVEAARKLWELFGV
jgi:hypothetical protein